MITIINMTKTIKSCSCGPDCGCSFGKRCSSRRGAVLRALSEGGPHLSAEEVHRFAGKIRPGIGIATVYRSLKCLCGCGKARELKPADGPAVYEAAGPGPRHDHLVCVSCGAIVEISDPAMGRLQARLAARHGFSPSGYRLDIYGNCSRCAKKDRSKI